MKQTQSFGEYLQLWYEDILDLGVVGIFSSEQPWVPLPEKISFLSRAPRSLSLALLSRSPMFSEITKRKIKQRLGTT